MPLPKNGQRTRIGLIAAAVLLAIAGVTLLLVGRSAQDHAPQPPASAAGTYAGGGADTKGNTSGRASAPIGAKGPILPRSTPTRLRIPTIGVDSSMVQLGLNSDGTVQVPSLGADSKPGWYRYSPSPGQLGPSILLGHIDSAKFGRGIFYKLGALRKGDTVSVQRADSTVAVFKIDAVARYPKNKFPTLTVYGNTDHAALRLITCGGKFNLSAHSYEDNIVAFASLDSSYKK